MNKFEILSKAYHTIKDLEDQSKQSHQFEFRPQAPDSNVNFEFKPFRIPKSESRQQQKARDCQAKLLAFWELKKNITTDDLTVINIATTSRRLQQIFGNGMSISRAIDVMIECGLLAEYNEKYSFNHYHYNYSKQYVFNKSSWRLFVNYCKDNNVLAYQYKNVENKKESNKQTVVDIFDKAFTMAKVEINSKGAYYKPLDMSCQQFEDFLYDCLRNNYKNLLCEYQDLADYINQNFYKDQPELQIQYSPTFTWNKRKTKVIKIGIRATNSTVSAKKSKEANDAPNIIYREDLMKKYNTMFEFDVKSSIPRVTYLLNTGKWLPMSIDLYEEIWKEMINQMPEFAEIEWNSQTRDIIKYFHMRGYFDTYDMIAAHTKRAISLKGNYKASEWSALDKIMKVYKKAVETALGGKLYDSEIFLHESNIYMKVAKHILSNDYKLMQCYDGFFTNKEIKDLDKVIEEIATSYYNEYKSNQINQINQINNESNITIEEYNKIIKERSNKQTIANIFKQINEYDDKYDKEIKEVENKQTIANIFDIIKQLE